MPRVRHQVASRKRRKKVLKTAKGSYGGRRKLYRTAKETVQRAMVYSYRDRRNKKRNFRSLWIVRINAACRLLGISSSRFMNGLKKMGVMIDRKNLAEVAVKDPQTFAQLAQMVQKGQ